MNFDIKSNEICFYNEQKEKLAYVMFSNVNESTVLVTTTFVSDVLRGQGVASKLMEALYDELKRTNRKAILKCSYAVNWFEKHQDKQDIICK